MMFISAGHNTTTSAIGNAVLRLARDGELQSRLRDNPDSIPAFAEEVVRVDAPQQAMRRIAIEDTELGGRAVAAGDFVWLVFGAANLDPAAFERVGEIDLERSPNRHFGFGRGIPQFIGAPLARLELRVAIEELLAYLVLRAGRRRRAPHVAAARGRPASAQVLVSRGSFRLSGGLSLSYLRWGEGPDVVLLHGGGLDATDWQEIAPALAATGRRVTAPDLRGCGERDWDPDARYGVEQTVADLDELVDELRLGR